MASEVVAIGYTARFQIRVGVVDYSMRVCSGETKRVDTDSSNAGSWEWGQNRRYREIPVRKGNLGVEDFGGYGRWDDTMLQDEYGLDHSGYSSRCFKMANLNKRRMLAQLDVTS